MYVTCETMVIYMFALLVIEGKEITTNKRFYENQELSQIFAFIFLMVDMKAFMHSNLLRDHYFFVQNYENCPIKNKNYIYNFLFCEKQIVHLE